MRSLAGWTVPLLFAFMLAGHGVATEAEAATRLEAEDGSGIADVDAATREQIEFERIRAAAEPHLAALDDVPEERRGDPEIPARAADALVALGPDVLPFLEAEVFGPSLSRYAMAVFTLGRIDAPEARQVLVRAIETFDGEESAVAMRKVQWAITALAVHANAEALDLIERLATPSTAHMNYMDEWTTTTVVAALGGDPARRTLLSWIEPLRKDPSRDARVRLAIVLDALERVPSPNNVEPILPSLDGGPWKIRLEAIEAIAASEPPELATILLDRIRDAEEDNRVRATAARALLRLRPADRLDDILTALELVEPATVRGPLYELVAEIGGKRAVPSFRSHRDRPDRLDRQLWTRALATTGDPEAVHLLRDRLTDPEVLVACEAVGGLVQLGTEAAIETALATLNDARWAVRARATLELAKRGVKRAAPRIADRLIREELGQTATNLETRERVREYGQALVALRYPDPRGEIRERIERQGDPELRDLLRRLVARLDVLAELGDDVDGWDRLLRSDDPQLARLAFERLAEIDTEAAHESLRARFQQVDDATRVDILRAVGNVPSPRAAKLVESVLLSPAYDEAPGPTVRAWAAWVAGRIGGRSMERALERSARRRHGRDTAVLEQWASLVGRDAAETLVSYRRDRLLAPSWELGPEQDRLDRLVRDLRAGRPIEDVDRPPTRTIETAH